jgi:uncharacterized membrane protein YgaE (UPF0421/DUF939 family)
MAAISDAVVIGIVLGLVFAAVGYYLYTRVSQLERKVSLMENILLDLKVTTEQTLLSTADYNESSGQQPSSEEELYSYQNAVDAAAADAVADMNSQMQDSEEELTNGVREVHLEQLTKSKTSSVGQVQVERDTEKASVSVNYESMTYKELVALAKQLGVSGIRNLSKAQLIDALRRRNDGSTSSFSESKQMELSSWAASPTVSFTEKQDDEKQVELGSAQDEDHQMALFSSMEQIESSVEQLDQIASLVQ